MKSEHYDPDQFLRDLNASVHQDSLDQKIRVLNVLRSNLYLDLKANAGKPGLELGPENFRTAQLLVKVIAQEADLEKQRKKFFTFNPAPQSLHALWAILRTIPRLTALLDDPSIQAEILARFSAACGEIGEGDSNQSPSEPAP